MLNSRCGEGCDDAVSNLSRTRVNFNRTKPEKCHFLSSDLDCLFQRSQQQTFGEICDKRSVVYCQYSVVGHETLFSQKSLSNQVAFCWSN